MRREVRDQFALRMSAGRGLSGVVLRQINFHRRAAGGMPDQRTLARAGAEHRLVVAVFLRRLLFARRGRQPPHERAAGDLDDEIFAGRTVHAPAPAALAVLREQLWLVILRDEFVEVVVRFEDDIAAASAVAAARAA